MTDKNKDLTTQENLDNIYDILSINLQTLKAIRGRIEALELKVEQRTSVMDMRFGIHD